MSLTNLYVRDKYQNLIHRVGDDPHDQLWVDIDGTVHYFNMQCGDGCRGYHSINEKKLSLRGREDEYECGYEFVPIMDGEISKNYLSSNNANIVPKRKTVAELIDIQEALDVVYRECKNIGLAKEIEKQFNKLPSMKGEKDD